MLLRTHLMTPLLTFASAAFRTSVTGIRKSISR